MKRIVMACLLAAPLLARADMVDLSWTGDTFNHKASIAPKKNLEICGALKKGAGVNWQFKSTAPADFNIHYHVGKDVTYPEKRNDIAGADGTLTAAMDQDYCWMWSNRSAQPIEVEVGLKQVKPIK